MRVIKPGGVLVSAVPGLTPEWGKERNVRSVFFLVEVTTRRLEALTKLFDAGNLAPRVGTVVPLGDVRRAHEMLAGAPHSPGKIVLHVADLE